jgi:formylglycine-generating enzyme required for sulfatase activity
MRLATVIACTQWVTMVGIMPGFAEKHLAAPGLDVRLALGELHDAMVASTSPRQEPFVRTISIVDAPAASSSASPAASVADPAAQAWAAVKDANSIAALEAFIRWFGDSFYADWARPRTVELGKQHTAQIVPLVPPVVGPLVVPAAAAGPCGGVSTVPLSSRGAAPLSAAEECALKPKDSFRECANCPELVVMPAASFTMGSPESEKDRRNDEGPQHWVTIGKPIAVGKFHVTVDQFAAFVAETGYDAGSKCRTFEDGKVEERSGRSWRNPGFAQSGSHPAVCLSLNDAKAYMDWLARKTGKPYRLLTEAEWEYAARARIEPGGYSRYSFGDDENDLCRHGNGADQMAKSTVPGASNWTIAPCNDGYAYTSPVGSFAANAFGLYDMQGNARQWTEDCYHDNYAGAPSDGSAWTTEDCSRRVLRGGSWSVDPRELRAAFRVRGTAVFRSRNDGFRVGRTLIP